MQQHEYAKKEFKKNMQAMMQHIEDEKAVVAQQKAQEREEHLYKALIDDVVDKIVAGAARNAVVERTHQTNRARWRADIERAVQDVKQKSVARAARQLHQD